MAVRLRLRKTGTVTKPCYRVVATDHRSPRDGKFIEVLGYYDPCHGQEQLNLERAEYWISNGAKPSQTVSDIIRRAKEGRPMTSDSDPKLAKRKAAVKATPAPSAAPVAAPAAPAPVVEEAAAPAAE